MPNTDFPDTLEFTNGLWANRVDHIPTEGHAFYSIIISGFNDPLVRLDQDKIPTSGGKISSHDVKTIIRGI